MLKYDVFISYNSQFKDWVEMLAQNLRSQNFNVFFDEWEIAAGNRIDEELDRGLEQSKNGIILATPEISNSSWVKDEYSKMKELAAKRDFKIIPIILGKEIPDFPFLRTIKCIDFSEPHLYRQNFHKLICALKGESPGPPQEFQGSLEIPFGFPANLQKKQHEQSKMNETEISTQRTYDSNDIFNGNVDDLKQIKDIQKIYTEKLSKGFQKKIDDLIIVQPFIGKKRLNEIEKLLNDDTFPYIKNSIKSKLLFKASLWHFSDKRQISKAENYLQQLKKIDPQKDIRRIEAARLYSKGRLKKAVSLLYSIRNPEALTQLFLYLGSDNLSKAVKWFDNARLSFDQLIDLGWNNVAIALAEVDRWDEALSIICDYRNFNKNASLLLAFSEAVIRTCLLTEKAYRGRILKGTLDFQDDILLENIKEKHQHRKKAIDCLNTVEDSLIQRIERYDVQDYIRQTRIHNAWLLLSDKTRHKESKKFVREQMKSLPYALDFIGIAAHFKIKAKLNLIESHLNERKILNLLNDNDLRAYLNLLIYKNNTKELISFLREYKGELIDKVLTPKEWYARIIEAHCLMQEYKEAELLLEKHSEILEEKASLSKAQILDHKGEDASKPLTDIYERTKKYSDLKNLCQYLEAKEKYNELYEYSKKLLKEKKDKQKNTITHAKCLLELNKFSEIISLKCDYFIPKSPELRKIKSWALFFMGKFLEAKDVAKPLFQKDMNTDTFTFKLNLDYFMGNWEEIQTIIQSNLTKTNDFTSEQLLLTAKIVSNYNKDLSIDFIKKAVQKSSQNADILLHSGLLFFQIGNDFEGSKYIHEAAKYSDPKGPVKAIQASDAKDILFESKNKSNDFYKMFEEAKITLHYFCKYYNIPLAKPFITCVNENIKENDIRKKPVIPIRHGIRNQLDLSKVKVIAMDITALYLAEVFKIFKQVLDAFDRIIIPWETMPILMEEESKARFQQPSKIQKAKKFRAFIDSRALKIMDENETPPQWLIKEIGVENASLLHAAKCNDGHFVIHSPLYRITTLLTELADLREYNQYLISPLTIVKSMNSEGLISKNEMEQAFFEFEKLGIEQLSDENLLGKGQLYLEDSLLDYLHYTDIFEQLCLFRNCYIHQIRKTEILELASADSKENEVFKIIQKIRKKLYTEIKNKKVICQQSHNPPDMSYNLANYQESFLKQLSHIDAVWLDDKFFSKYQYIPDSNGKKVLLVGIWDICQSLMQRKIISRSELYEINYRMRKANLTSIPVDHTELEYWICQSNVDSNGNLIESTELKAIRQNFQFCFYSTCLPFQEEITYWQNIRSTIQFLIKKFWIEGQDLKIAISRSNWLIKSLFVSILDFNNMEKNKEKFQLSNLCFIEISRFIDICLKDESRKKLYLNWLESIFLKNLHIANSDVIKEIVEYEKKIIKEILKSEEIIFDPDLFMKNLYRSLPETLFQQIEKDKYFLRKANLPCFKHIHFGNIPAINCSLLFDTVRKVFTDNKKIEIVDVKNNRVQILSSDDKIKIYYTDSNGKNKKNSVLSLGLLHPDSSIRLQTFEKMLQYYGPTHPGKTKWIGILSKRSLKDEEIMEYYDSFNYILPIIKNNIYLKAREPVNKTPIEIRDTLVPVSIHYFENICAPAPKSHMNQKMYISKILVPRMQQAIELDLLQGLEMILPMGVQEELIANNFINDIPDEEIQYAIKRLSPFNDPISKMNVFAICMNRLNNQFFFDLSHKIKEEVFSEEIHHNKIDINILFNALLQFTTDAIQLNPQIRQQPVYWKRLCAWTQAGHLTRLFAPDTNSNSPEHADWINSFFIDWLKSCHQLIHVLADLLELIDVPYSRAHTGNHFDVNAFYKIHIAVLEKETTKKSIQELFPEDIDIAYQMLLPGILDTDLKKHSKIDTNIFKNITSINAPLKIDDENNWFYIHGACHFFPASSLPIEKICEIVLSSLKNVRIEDLNRELSNEIHTRCIDIIAQISQKLRDSDIIEQVLNILLGLLEINAKHEYLIDALCSCMGYKNMEKAIKKYSEFLLKASLKVNDVHFLLFIYKDIICNLKKLLPVNLWFFTKVEALCRAA